MKVLTLKILKISQMRNISQMILRHRNPRDPLTVLQSTKRLPSPHLILPQIQAIQIHPKGNIVNVCDGFGTEV